MGIRADRDDFAAEFFIEVYQLGAGVRVAEILIKAGGVKFDSLAVRNNLLQNCLKNIFKVVEAVGIFTCAVLRNIADDIIQMPVNIIVLIIRKNSPLVHV